MHVTVVIPRSLNLQCPYVENDFWNVWVPGKGATEVPQQAFLNFATNKEIP